MTEADLRKRPEFANLPVYDEADDRCDSLIRYYDTDYDGTICEPVDELEYLKCIADPMLVVKGAIKYSATDVRAIFWRKR